jgi:hypothetical protein
MTLATSVTVHVIAQTITDTAHVKPQCAKRIEVGSYTFLNKYKFMIQKIIFMPQLKETFVGSQRT